MYLLDTNVVSAGIPTKTHLASGLIDWMDRHSAVLFLSVVTIAEIESGIARVRRQGGHRKADRLAEWLETMLHLYSAQILPLDIATARMLGRIADIPLASGQAPGYADSAIAATARCRGFTILTRNDRHFSALGIQVHDPFKSLPAESRTTPTSPPR
jgi:predicted nucleic acid-binding protein